MRITAYVLRTMLITIALCQKCINLAFNLREKKLSRKQTQPPPFDPLEKNAVKLEM